MSVISPAAVMAEVERIMSAHWQWGAADCCAAACDVFEALHGIDPLAPLRGTYNSAIGAARLIRTWGGFSAIADALAAGAGLGIGQGATGEIGLSVSGAARGPEQRALLVCIQPGAWAGKTETGYAIINTAERSWRA